jgi:hypothetical protein
MSLDRDIAAVGLQPHRAVAQGEGRAAGAIEKSGGDKGVEGENHARAIPRQGLGA